MEAWENIWFWVRPFLFFFWVIILFMSMKSVTIYWKIPSIICFSFEWPICIAKDIDNPVFLYLKICIEIQTTIKNIHSALAGVAQQTEHQPADTKVTSLISCQGRCLGCWPGLQVGVCARQPTGFSHTSMFLYHSFSLPSSLSKN